MEHHANVTRFAATINAQAWVLEMEQIELDRFIENVLEVK